MANQAFTDLVQRICQLKSRDAMISLAKRESDRIAPLISPQGSSALNEYDFMLVKLLAFLREGRMDYFNLSRRDASYFLNVANQLVLLGENYNSHAAELRTYSSP